MAADAAEWELYVPPALERQIEALAGKSAGLQAKLDQLKRDPCQASVGGYRLSGPLAPVVCGAHLKRGYRIAYTTQRSPTDEDAPRVIVLYVGRREPGHRSGSDVWDVLHDVFGVDNPADGHFKPPCCEADLPRIDQAQLDSFVRSLRRFQRRRAPRRSVED